MKPAPQQSDQRSVKSDFSVGLLMYKDADEAASSYVLDMENGKLSITLLIMPAFCLARREVSTALSS